jgi:hypothetical protein
LRLQGTQGHPDAYNMGYGTRVKYGVPEKWYPADCGDVLLGILNVAAVLPSDDPFRKRLLESAMRHTDYVLDEWSLPDGGIGAYIEDYKVYKQHFWCSNARMCAALWGFEEILEDGRYLSRALELTRCCLEMECKSPTLGYSPEINYNYGFAVYVAEAMCIALSHMSGSQEDLRKAALKHLGERFIPWAIRTQNRAGCWTKGVDDGYMGMIINNLIHSLRHTGMNPELQKTIDNAFMFAEESIPETEIEGRMKWGRNTNLGLAFATRIDLKAVFPRMS